MGGIQQTLKKGIEGTILGPVGQVAGTLAGAKSDIERSAASKIPPVQKPLQVPTIDSQAVQDAKRRSLLAQIARRGRASTILTSQTSDKLGPA